MSARLAGFPAYVSLSRLTTRSSGCSRRTWRTKLLPMKPAPPVTTSFIGAGAARPAQAVGGLFEMLRGSAQRCLSPAARLGSSARDLPHIRPAEVPRQPTLVTRRRIGGKVHVGEIHDAPATVREIAHAMRDARRDDQQPRGAVAEHHTLSHALGA